MTVDEQFPIDPIIFKKYRESVDLTNFPKGFVKGFTELSVEEQREWYEGRFRCLKYHLYLSGFAEALNPGDPAMPKEYVPILGMDFQPDPHNLLFNQFVQKRPGEGLVMSDLDQLTKKRMILWPRNHLKTSAVIVDMVQTILNYPDCRIMFLTGSDKLAMKQLRRLKDIFEKPSRRFQWLFPEFCMKSVRNKKIADDLDPRAWTDTPCRLGNAHEFTVPCRTNTIFAEPTFAISTARSVKAGSHFDGIYVDDLVNEQNFRSVTALGKCYEDYLAITPLKTVSGFMVVTGTRYSFGDTYERIQEDAQKEMKETGQTVWKFSIRDCWSHGCQNCVHTSVYHDYDKNILQPPCIVPGCACPGFKDRGNRDVLFPRIRLRHGPRVGEELGFTLQILASELAQVGPEFFANQYENKPIATGSQTFDETLIGRQTLHHMTQIPDYGVSYTFAVGDLAYVGQEGRDYSVIFLCRLFQGQIFIYACEFGAWDSGQVAENIVSILLNPAHRPSVVYLEKFNGWEAYQNVILAYARSRGLLKVPIEWVKASQTPNAKTIRIGTVKGPLSAKRLWFYAGMKGYDQLVKQLCKWPKLGRHDDFADCAGMVVAAPTNYQLDSPPADVSIVSWLRKMNEGRVEDDSYYDNGCGSNFCC
jgi:hypothetical protein